MLNAATDVGLMLFVGKCRAYVAHRMEVVSLNVTLVHSLKNHIYLSLTLLGEVGGGFKCNYLKCIIEVVENNHHLI